MNETWRVSIPGVPPSVNHMYQPAVRLTSTGSHRTVRKAEGVEAYQDNTTLFVRTGMPSSWRKMLEAHKGYIRIKYWFYLQRDIDCDNALKALNDAIAKGLNVDDKRFLPYVVDKLVNKKNDPRVELEFSFHERAP